ncbi:VanZ family protein [Streptomyces sp. NPDC093510]|uniref:VanZ family protein n=1 Tax=Streptomyces sp. NPDC093510 TaxID=3155199 RepID=UPI00344173CC
MAVVGCLALSVVIEAAQLVMNAGRVADVDDVLFNTAGALTGCLMAQAAWAVTRQGVESGAGRHAARARPVRSWLGQFRG